MMRTLLIAIALLHTTAVCQVERKPVFMSSHDLRHLPEKERLQRVEWIRSRLTGSGAVELLPKGIMVLRSTLSVQEWGRKYLRWANAHAGVTYDVEITELNGPAKALARLKLDSGRILASRKQVTAVLQNVKRLGGIKVKNHLRTRLRDKARIPLSTPQKKQPVTMNDGVLRIGMTNLQKGTFEIRTWQPTSRFVSMQEKQTLVVATADGRRLLLLRFANTAAITRSLP